MTKDKLYLEHIEAIGNRYANLLINTDPIVSHFKDKLNEKFLFITSRYEDSTRIYGWMKILHSRTSYTELYTIVLNATFFKTVNKQNLEYEILRTVAHEIFHMCQRLYILRLYDYNENNLGYLRSKNQFMRKPNKHVTKREIAPRMFEVGLLNDYNSFIEYMHEGVNCFDE